MTKKPIEDPAPVDPTDYGLNLDDLPDLLDIRTACAALGVSDDTVRGAIRSGELRAYIPRGKAPGRAGRLGYRILKRDLERWYFRAVPR